MNNQLEQFARSTLKTALAKLSEKSQECFKLMYGKPIDPKERRTPGTIARIKATSITTTVDEMDTDKLDWAMQQVANTKLGSSTIQIRPPQNHDKGTPDPTKETS